MAGIADLLSKITQFKGNLPSIASNLTSILPSGGTDDAPPPPGCPQTRFDRWIESINRTVRPIILFGVMLMFLHAWASPVHFAEFAGALKQIPDMGWYTIFIVVTAWFTTKGIQDFRNSGNAAVATPAPTPPVQDTATDTAQFGRFGSSDEHHELVHDLAPHNDAIEAWKNAPKRVSKKG